MKSLSSLLLAGLLSGFSVVACAVSFVPQPPPIAGKAYFLMDYHSQMPLAELNADQRIEPASLTKLMTIYLTFQALKNGQLHLNQPLHESQDAWKTEGSRTFLDPRVPVTLEDVIKGVIVQSGNDACVTLAETVGGSEAVFAQLMNFQAQKLGMKHSHFMNSTGLPNPGHYTTVHDLAILTTALIRDFPEYYHFFSIKSFTYNHITQANRNGLLFTHGNVDGLKTGHTESAGFNLIASDHVGARRLISVVVGTDSARARETENAKLLNYGLQFFDTPKLYGAHQAILTEKIYKGVQSSEPLGFDKEVYVTIPKGEASKLHVALQVNKPLVAPIKAGTPVGHLTVTLQGKTVMTRPVVALNTVQQGGFFSRLWGDLGLKFGW